MHNVHVYCACTKTKLKAQVQSRTNNTNALKKVSSMNKVESNRSPIFCVCELLVSDIEEALSRSQCLRTTMQQYKLCNYATVQTMQQCNSAPTV